MNNQNQKGFTNVFLIAVVVIVVGVAGYFTLVKKSEPIIQQPTPTPALPTPTPTPSPTSTLSPDETAGWKTYTNTQYGFTFQYPSIISVKQDGESITLSHSVAYTHPNPCDFKGDAPPMDKLSDFGVSITVSNKNLADTKKDSFVWSYDKFNVGFLSGFKGESGIEGCGLYTYLFPISENSTLVIKRAYVTEFKPIISDYQKYLALPGIINPAQEEEYFTKILSTFKFIR